MARTLGDSIRATAHRYLDSLGVEKVLALFPDLVRQPVAPTANQRRPVSPPRPQRRAAPRTKKREITPEIGQEIRTRLKGLQPGTPAYERARDGLCVAYNLTPHQIFGAFRGWRTLNRSKRKKR